MKTVGRLMLLCATLALGACAAGVSSGYGQGGLTEEGRSYEEARADRLLTSAVNRLLVGDKQVRAMDIRVHALDGVVTLGGEVQNEQMAQRAEELARSVDGVRDVVNELQVRP